jgi:hypothetical protein
LVCFVDTGELTASLGRIGFERCCGRCNGARHARFLSPSDLLGRFGAQGARIPRLLRKQLGRRCGLR